MGNRSQHRSPGPRATREAPAGHALERVRRPNGDDYCRSCGQLVLCRHGRNNEAFDHGRPG